MGQNAEVMPRPLNSSIAIYSLEVRTFFCFFCFKETHAWFCADYFCISYGVEICSCLYGYPGIRNMQPFVVNGGLMRVCVSVTPSMAVLCEKIKIKGCTAFLSKVKHKFVNNSCSN